MFNAARWFGTMSAYRVARIACAMSAAGILFGTADAAVVVYDSRESFQGCTGAISATGALPNIGRINDPGVVGGTGTIGSVTFGLAPGGSSLFIGGNGISGLPNGDWYPESPGHDIAMGFENLKVVTSAPVHSMGWVVWEPDATMLPFGGTPADSTYQVTLFRAGLQVGQFTYNNPEDVEAFVGVWSTEAFDEAHIIDVTSSDNEYFGEFFTGTRVPPPCVGDINADGVVNTTDLVTFLGAFGRPVPPANPNADLNCDGVVNTRDLTTFLGRFGTAC